MKEIKYANSFDKDGKKIVEICEIDYFDERGLNRALKNLKLKEIKCTVCGRIISKNEISCFYPIEKGVGIACDSPGCGMVAIIESEDFKKHK